MQLPAPRQYRAETVIIGRRGGRAAGRGSGSINELSRAFVTELMAEVKVKNPSEPEFHQAVQEVAESLALVLERHRRRPGAKFGSVDWRCAV